MKILPKDLKQAELIRTVYVAQPEPGTTLDEMLKPEYWAHVAKDLKLPGTRIEVMPAGGEWFAELYVRSVGKQDAKVSVLRHVVFDAPQKQDDDYDVRSRGGAGWSVVRKSDKAVLFEKGQTRADAEAELAKIKAANLG